jgi:hypothetical protein
VHDAQPQPLHAPDRDASATPPPTPAGAATHPPHLPTDTRKTSNKPATSTTSESTSLDSKAPRAGSSSSFAPRWGSSRARLALRACPGTRLGGLSVTLFVPPDDKLLTSARPRDGRLDPRVRCAHAWPPSRAVRRGSRGRAGAHSGVPSFVAVTRGETPTLASKRASRRIAATFRPRCKLRRRGGSLDCSYAVCPEPLFRLDLTGHCAEGGGNEVLMQITRSVSAKIRKWLGLLGKRSAKTPYGAGAAGR